MQEIIKFRQAEAKKGIKEVVTKDDVVEMEEQYEAMIYEKEETQIAHESDLNAQLEEIKKVEATIAALDKRYTEVQRESKLLDYELSRNNQPVPTYTSKVSQMNLSRIQKQATSVNARVGGARIGRGNELATGSVSINSRGGLRNMLKKPSISASVDISSRLGGGGAAGVGHSVASRFQSLKTPGGGALRSSIDREGVQLEQIISRQEKTISKSLIVDTQPPYGGVGTSLTAKGRYNVVPHTTKSRHALIGNSNHTLNHQRDINDLNVSVIPPPTSIHQHDLMSKRVRKFSAKMSTAIGSERGNSRNGPVAAGQGLTNIAQHAGSNNRYLGRHKRSISQINN